MENHKILENTIQGGYCIGCGVCKVVDKKIDISMNDYGMYQASLSNEKSINTTNAIKVCPFSNESENEDEIGAELFHDNCSYNKQIGYYKNLYAGYVTEKNYRERGTSGGIITWVLTELLRRGKIDAVIHVRKTVGEVLYQYEISNSINDVIAGAKSKYYPVELSKVLNKIKNTSKKYAIVGLPCFIKAVRNLAKIDQQVNQQIVYYVGMVCGHLKSKAFAESFGWQSGITPGKLEEIDFRVKLENKPSSHYGVLVKGEEIESTKPVRDLIGANWGHNLFRYPACDFCDDVFAETADLVVGDAWLPRYENDSKGTSIVVNRNEELQKIFVNGFEEGRLFLENVSEDQIIVSQAGGIRDRREGLAFRLWLKKKMKKWAPKKRVKESNNNLSYKRKSLYRTRSKIGAESHEVWKMAKENKSYEEFIQFIEKSIENYNRSYFTLAQRLNYKLSLIKYKIVKNVKFFSS